METAYMRELRTKVRIAERVFIAPTAVVTGQVSLATLSSVWFNAVLRGDADSIAIGEGSNVQDGCVVHVDPGFPVSIGRHVTIGHRAIVHGCTVGDYTIIGMGSILLNGARIGSNCIIGAGAVVPEDMEVPDGSLVLGIPAKVARQLTESQMDKVKRNAEAYIALAGKYGGWD